MDHIGFERHDSQAKHQAAGGVDGLGIRAFQIDPGWYEAHWLTRPESKPLWAIRWITAGFWTLAAYVSGLRLALSELPSETGYQPSDFRIDAFPTWFGHSGPGA